jgi:glutaminyl-tRNA synthetase
VKGTLHWVSAAHALHAEVRLFDHLFLEEPPEEEVPPGAEISADGELLDETSGPSCEAGSGGPDRTFDFSKLLNPESRVVLAGCKVESGLGDARPGVPYQFLRKGYFTVDSADSTPDGLVFNRSVGLRDTWGKIQKAQKKG